MLRSPLVAVACIGLVFWGVTLLWQAAFRSEPDPLGFNAAFRFRGEGVRHSERTSRRVGFAGVALIVAGVGLLVLWGLQF